MIQLLLDGVYRDIELIHVRMNFSKSLDSAGKLEFAKVLELFRVISKIYWARFKYGLKILYYPPSGPRLVPILRDVIILGMTRWLFDATVFHFHASGISDYVKKSSLLLRALVRIAFANPELAIHISNGGPRDGLSMNCKREIVIPNGIPDAAGESIARSTRGGARINILFVAVLREDKGVLVAIQATLELLRKGADLRLTCLGKWESGKLEARALAMIEPAFKDCFDFPGVIAGAEKWEYYRKADVFLFPSFFHSETFPVVLLEAMCFSLPVVAARWRGIPEVVEEGSCALLCEPRDAAGCRDALAQLVEDASLRERMGQKSRERYLRYFTVEAHRRAMESALSQWKDR
jgi:glycosyltransferase involved in cell wall biosynthesis